MNRATVSPGRFGALEALLAVDRGQHVEDALASYAPQSPADRSLAWNLALGVLRTRSALDEVIVGAARRPLTTIEPAALAILRAGVYELRFTRTPPHAAVDQAVAASRRLDVGHAAGFINAVLRNQGAITPSSEALLGHPAWIVARWRARHGSAADAWMTANNQPAATYIVPKEDPGGVARAFQHAGASLHAHGDTFRVEGSVPELPGFAEGRWWVMDPAALAVADLVGDLPAGTRVLDACVAPGGKAFRLASRGFAVTGTDSDPARLARAREGAVRLDLPIHFRVFDWSQAAPDRTWPVVVVDAPCTGLGTLRRHADIRWRRQPEDVASAAARQRAILHHAAGCVERGGALVYAVCSPEPEEGVEVAATLGWRVEATFDNAPGTAGEDVFWAVRLRAPG